MNTLKYFIRIDGKGNLIAGSGIWRQKMPKIGRWKALDLNECCLTSTSTTTTTTTAATTTTSTTTVTTTTTP